MSVNQRERFNSPADREAFEQAIRDNLSPDAVATAICYLRCAEFGNQPDGERALAALREVEWLADVLTEMLGVDEHNRLIDELGL
jgi:hypothetical protein